MRVVADTNTVVSAFLWGGPPAAVLAAARDGRITLFTSPVLLAELEDVLSREKFAERIARVGSSVAQMMAGYRALGTVVRPAAIEPTVRDPDDDHVLACATAAQAQLIVSIYTSTKASRSWPPRTLCSVWMRSNTTPKVTYVKFGTCSVTEVSRFTFVGEATDIAALERRCRL